MTHDMVKRKINKKKSKRTSRPIPNNILKLLEAMGRIKTIVRKSSRYVAHQGPRECARRARHMARNRTPTPSM